MTAKFTKTTPMTYHTLHSKKITKRRKMFGKLAITVDTGAP